MMKFEFPAISSILCLGAHCDDIEIGCGASILNLLERFPHVHVRWVVFSSSPTREAEARRSAALFLAHAKTCEVSVHTFRDGYFPWEGLEIKEEFEALKAGMSPDLIFTHYREDRHQDHRIISDLSWNTWRDHLVLEYEIPKYDGDLGSPNLFVDVSGDQMQKKISYIVQSFPSQSDKQWFSEETFSGLMRLRGMEANSLYGYAEGFYCRKACL